MNQEDVRVSFYLKKSEADEQGGYSAQYLLGHI